MVQNTKCPIVVKLIYDHHESLWLNSTLNTVHRNASNHNLDILNDNMIISETINKITLEIQWT